MEIHIFYQNYSFLKKKKVYFIAIHFIKFFPTVFMIITAK